MAQPLFGHCTRDRINLERIDRSELAEHSKIVSRTAADLEQLRSFREFGPSPDQRRDDFTSGTVPPMSLVVFRHRLVNRAIHQRKTHCRLSVKVTTGVMNSIGGIGAARPSCRWVNISHTQKLLSK